ncbi:MAG: hypothetical protein BroJett040_03220 [Oligoflexia bacterium]|nr:MAG: hypothetical protein BroJett040_03220 [Oligoflexia bacterium]
MKISFFRKYAFEARVQNIARAFYLSVGVSTSLDSQSGMTVNMMDLDRWADSILCRLQQLDFKSESDLLIYLFTEYQKVPEIQSSAVCVQRIELETIALEKWVLEPSNF